MELGEKTKKVKVVYILNIYPKISETFILNEILSIREKGVDIEIVAYKSSGETREHPRAKEIKVTYFEKKGFFKKVAAHVYWVTRQPLRYLSTWKLVMMDGEGIRKNFFWDLTESVMIAEKKPDHVHAHFGDESSNAALLLHSLSGIPYTFTTHSYDIFDNKYNNWKVKSRLAKKHITISEYNKSYLVDRHDVDPSDILIIHCGVDFRRIQRNTGSRSSNLLYSAARLHKEKGLDILIRALTQLKAKGISFRCEIAGDGEEKQELERLIVLNDLRSEVKLLGNQTQEEVFAKLAQAAIFVLPSRSEGIPVSLMEAMAFGAPVLSTAICGIPELISNDVSGFLVPPDNVDLLAEKIEALLKDEKLRAAFSDKGYEKVSRDFDLHKESSKLLDLWKAAA